MRNIAERLKKLERRPQSQFPQFTIEHSDGHRENWHGMDVLGHLSGRDDVRRICYDGGHQASVDGAALLAALGWEVEEFPQYGKG